MPKNKKRRKRNHSEEKADYGLKKATKQFNWRLAGRLLLNFTIVFCVYLLALNYAERQRSPMLQEIILAVFYGVTTILACVFVILNRGVSNDIPTKEQLRDDWDDAKKEAFIKKYTESKAKAKKILPWLIPMIFTILFDTIYLLYFVK